MKTIKRKIWDIGVISQRAKVLTEKYNISKFFAQVLINRDIEDGDIQSIFKPSNVLSDSWLLPDIKNAISRIRLAVNGDEKILVVGDYDVDGIVSLVVFDKYVKQSHAKVEYYIPHRVNEGYGLTPAVIEYAKSKNITLIVTFDCGTDANEAVRLAAGLGIDVVVTDHHAVKTANYAYALVNPKRTDSGYPFKYLSGAGIAFKLTQLLTGEDCVELLDLVALSIVCDIVPLRDENRTLLIAGMRQLKLGNRYAIQALCKSAGIKPSALETFHLGFVLGPRINAAGRVAHADEALRLFLTDDTAEADLLAQKLNRYSITRKGIEANIIKEITDNESDFADDNVIVVCGENWHHGVLGIVASRLVERHYKPVFVISSEGELAKGSARSIHSVNLIELLAECGDLVLSYGGHFKAAGLNLFKDKIKLFKDMVNRKVNERLSDSDFIPRLNIDFFMNFADITKSFVDELDKLRPYGEGMPAAVFMSERISKKTQPKRVGYGYSLWLTDGEKTFEGVCYSKDLAEKIALSEKFDIAYNISKNRYHNSLRLTICDAR